MATYLINRIHQCMLPEPVVLLVQVELHCMDVGRPKYRDTHTLSHHTLTIA
jgi:hypothetical protein